MKENEKKENKSTLAIEVTIKDFNAKGELIDAIVAGSKLTKADSGRQAFKDEDSITLKFDGCGCPKVEIDVNSTSQDTAERFTRDTTLELNVDAQKYDFEKKALVPAIQNGSKLTKADAGREANAISEDWFNLRSEAGCDGACPKTEVHANSKVTKAEIVK